MESSSQYIVNTPDVVAEVIDGELVAIQLRTGCYYHANATGGIIWNVLATGGKAEDAIVMLQKKYGISEQQASVSVDEFIEKLIYEELVRVAENQQVYEGIEQDMDVDQPYEQPILKKHEDMKELLLLDPIHDVGEATWPLQPVWSRSSLRGCSRNSHP